MSKPHREFDLNLDLDMESQAYDDDVQNNEAEPLGLSGQSQPANTHEDQIRSGGKDNNDYSGYSEENHPAVHGGYQDDAQQHQMVQRLALDPRTTPDPAQMLPLIWTQGELLRDMGRSNPEMARSNTDMARLNTDIAKSLVSIPGGNDQPSNTGDNANTGTTRFSSLPPVLDSWQSRWMKPNATFQTLSTRKRTADDSLSQTLNQPVHKRPKLGRHRVGGLKETVHELDVFMDEDESEGLDDPGEFTDENESEGLEDPEEFIGGSRRRPAAHKRYNSGAAAKQDVDARRNQEDQEMQAYPAQPDKQCWNCLEYGHLIGNCPFQSCFRCGQDGHNSLDCTIGCKCQDQAGHPMVDCPISCPRTICGRKDRHKAVECSPCCICGEQHTAFECTHKSCKCGDVVQHFALQCSKSLAAHHCRVTTCTNAYTCRTHCQRCGSKHRGRCYTDELKKGLYACRVAKCKGTYWYGTECKNCTYRRSHYKRFKMDS
jgi:hypothetical protein